MVRPRETPCRTTTQAAGYLFRGSGTDSNDSEVSGSLAEAGPCHVEGECRRALTQKSREKPKGMYPRFLPFSNRRRSTAGKTEPHLLLGSQHASRQPPAGDGQEAAALVNDVVENEPKSGSINERQIGRFLRTEV